MFKARDTKKVKESELKDLEAIDDWYDPKAVKATLRGRKLTYSSPQLSEFDKLKLFFATRKAILVALTCLFGCCYARTKIEDDEMEGGELDGKSQN